MTKITRFPSDVHYISLNFEEVKNSAFLAVTEVLAKRMLLL